MSCAKTCGGLFARSVLRTFHSPAGRPSTSVPTTKVFGRAPGGSPSNFHRRIESSAEADTASTARAVSISHNPANLSGTFTGLVPLLMTTARSLPPSTDERRFRRVGSSCCWSPWSGPTGQSPFLQDQSPLLGACASQGSVPHVYLGRAIVPSP